MQEKPRIIQMAVKVECLENGAWTFALSSSKLKINVITDEPASLTSMKSMEDAFGGYPNVGQLRFAGKLLPKMDSYVFPEHEYEKAKQVALTHPLARVTVIWHGGLESEHDGNFHVESWDFVKELIEHYNPKKERTGKKN